MLRLGVLKLKYPDPVLLLEVMDSDMVLFLGLGVSSITLGSSFMMLITGYWSLECHVTTDLLEQSGAE